MRAGLEQGGRVKGESAKGVPTRAGAPLTMIVNALREDHSSPSSLPLSRWMKCAAVHAGQDTDL